MKNLKFRWVGLEIDGLEDGFELRMKIIDSRIVHDVIVGHGDGAAFFDGFDFVVVAGAGGL